jgi:hypothetical protein
MKQLIFHLVLFALFLLLVLFLVIGTIGTIAPKTFDKNIKNKRGDVGHMYTRMKELKSTGKVDVLVIGSSHAYRGFDPRIFAHAGIKIFDLGSSAQTPIQTEILVKKYSERLGPKLVIFEVFPGVFSNDGVESSVDLISNGPIDFSTIMMALRINNLITYNTLFFHSFKKLFLKDNFKEPDCKNGECYIPGGYVQRTELVGFKGEHKGSPRNWVFRGDQINAFTRTLAFLKEKNYQTILIQAPITYNFYDSYGNNPEIDRFFQKFGVDYYNINTCNIGKCNALFYDRDHLNQKGVAEFNSLVLALIKGKPGWTEKSSNN